MATATFDAETGTDGTTLTAANSGWGVVTGSWAFQAAAARSGVLGYRGSLSGTTIMSLAGTGLTSGVGSNAQRHRGYIRVSAYPTSGTAIIFVTRASNAAEKASIRMDTTGHLLVFVNGGATAVFTSTYVVPLNTWVRIEMVISGGGGTTSTGILGFGAVTGTAVITTTNSSTNAYYYSTASAVGSTAAFGNYLFGKMDSTSSWTANFDLDDVAGDNSTDAAKTWTSAPSTWLGPGATTFSSVLAAAATAGFTIGGRKDLGGAVPLAAAGAMSVSGSNFAVRSATLATSAAASLAIGSSGNSAVLPLAGAGALAVGGSRTMSAGLVLAGTGAMALAATQALSAVLAMRGTPILVLAPDTSRSIVWAARGTPGLTVGGPVSIAALASFQATAAMEILGRVIADIHPYDNVTAVLLEPKVAAVILPHRKSALLLDNGKGIADVLSNSATALLLPGGMLAVIQD